MLPNLLSPQLLPMPIPQASFSAAPPPQLCSVPSSQACSSLSQPLKRPQHLPQLVLDMWAKDPCPRHWSFWTPPSPSSSQRCSQLRAQEQRRGFPDRALGVGGIPRESGEGRGGPRATLNEARSKRECDQQRGMSRGKRVWTEAPLTNQ